MIVPWNPTLHMPLLGKWLKTRNQADGAGGRELYPATGYVVDNIVVGFLYRTDAPGVGWIDGIVSDPGSSESDRAVALKSLVRELYAEADRQGLTLVWACTAVPSLIALGQAAGAKVFQTGLTCLAWTSPRR